MEVQPERQLRAHPGAGLLYDDNGFDAVLSRLDCQKAATNGLAASLWCRVHGLWVLGQYQSR